MSRAWVFPIALMLLLAVAHPLRVNHDVGMFLAAGRMVIEGKRPFINIVDTNPPLIMLLSAIPAELERVLPLHITTIFTLLATAAVAASTASLSRLLRQPETGLTPTEADVAALAWAALSLAVDIERSLGQRDHLFALAFFPYLVLRWIRWQGGGAGPAPAAALGVAAGTVACLRPWFTVLLLAVEGACLIRRRSPVQRALASPEMAGALLAFAAYGTYFLLAPDVREALFGRWGPLIAANYDLWDQPARTFVRLRAVWFALVLGTVPIALALAMRLRRAGGGPGRPAAGLACLVGATTLACLAHYVLARKAWSYRAIPSTAGATLVLGLVVVPAVLRSSWNRVARAAVLAAVCAAPFFLWKSGLASLGTHSRGASAQLWAAVETHSRPGDALLFLTTNVIPTHPITVQLDRRPATRFLSLFPIGFAYRGVRLPPGGGPFPYRGAAPTPDEARVLAELVADVERSRPAMIFVPAPRMRQPTLPRGFQMAEYLEANGILPRLLEGFRPVGQFDGYDAYARER